MDNKITSIERKITGEPTIVKGTIEENCVFENTIMGGYGTLIIDKEFIDDMASIAQSLTFSNSFIDLFSQVCNKVSDYYTSNQKNELQREETYSQNVVVNEDGMIIGTKISSLKGKNISKCSEKTIAAYIIFKYLFDNNKITRLPSLVLSKLGVFDSEKREPHAFMTFEKESDNYPTKYLLFDIENPTEIADDSGKKYLVPGLYSLTDEEQEAIEIGNQCSPISLFELIGNFQEIGAKRIYGSIIKTKKM